VMKQSIKNSRGNDRITKNFIPLGETTVGGEDHGSFLITARDELEEKMSAVTVNRNVADLINNKEFGLTIELQPLFNAIFSVGSGEVGNKRRGWRAISSP